MNLSRRKAVRTKTVDFKEVRNNIVPKSDPVCILCFDLESSFFVCNKVPFLKPTHIF